jgi:hypothetical protein
MSSITNFVSNFFASIPPDLVLSVIIVGLLALLTYGAKKLQIVINFTSRLKKSIKSLTNENMIIFSKLQNEVPLIADLLAEFKEMVFDNNHNAENSDTILSEDKILHAIGVSEESLEHYPGTFTALGIGGTFIGILFALVPIQKDIEQSDVLIENLLNGAGTAFITSIFGIGFSIAFLLATRYVMSRFKRTVFEFHLKLNGLLTRITPEQVLSEIQLDLREDLLEIKDSLAGMADDIGSAVTKNIKEAFENLNEGLKNSITAAGSSSQDIVSNVMSSIEGTVERLETGSVAQLESLEHFDTSITHATEFVEYMEKILPDLKSTSENFAKSAKQLENLPESLKTLSKTQEDFSIATKESIDYLVEHWQEEKNQLSSMLEGMAGQFDKFEQAMVKGVQNTMSLFDDELSRAGTYIATWTGELNSQISEFNAQLKVFHGAVHDGGSGLQDVIRNFANNLDSQAAALDTHISSLNNSMSDGFTELVTSIQQLPLEVNTSIEGISDIYKEVTQQLPKLLSDHLQNLVNELNTTSKSRGFRDLFNIK